MPWQKHWALVCGEYEEIELPGIPGVIRMPAYRVGFDTTPRQSGKTLLKVAQYLHRAFMWKSFDRRPQLITYSAQSGSDARKKFRKEHVPMLRNSPIDKAIKKYRYAADDSGLDFVNQAIMTILSTSRSSGHGSTIDLAILDEIFEDTDDRREQAVLPAMATRHDAQMLLTSTAGDDASIVYNQKQEQGRRAVESGATTGMAYCEFAMEEDDDPEDPRVWRRVHPALGHTITEATIQASLDAMKADPEEGIDGFRRAWGNVSQKHSIRRPALTAAEWAPVVDPQAEPSGEIMFGADATPDRSAASIVACDTNGVVEIIDHRPGADWIEDRLEELLAAHRGSSAVVWARGQLGQVPTRVEGVTSLTSSEYADACALFTDAILNRTVQIVPVRHLYQALEVGALSGSRTYSGDQWRWGRVHEDTDISPLVAATLAHYRAVVTGQGTDPLVAYA